MIKWSRQMANVCFDYWWEVVGGGQLGKSKGKAEEEGREAHQSQYLLYYIVRQMAAEDNIT